MIRLDSFEDALACRYLSRVRLYTVRTPADAYSIMCRFAPSFF